MMALVGRELVQLVAIPPADRWAFELRLRRSVDHFHGREPERQRGEDGVVEEPELDVDGGAAADA